MATYQEVVDLGPVEKEGTRVRTLETAKPRPELSEFVQVYAQREMECGNAVFSQPSTSNLEQGIAFEIAGTTMLDFPDGSNWLAPKVWVFGSLTPKCRGGAHFSGHVLGFAILLKPVALWQLFRIPSSILANKAYPAEDLLGKGVLDLLSIVAESKTFQHRTRAAEEYLLPHAMQARGLQGSRMCRRDRLSSGDERPAV